MCIFLLHHGILWDMGLVNCRFVNLVYYVERGKCFHKNTKVLAVLTGKVANRIFGSLVLKQVFLIVKTNRNNKSSGCIWNNRFEARCYVLNTQISLQLLMARCKINGTLWQRSILLWVFDGGQQLELPTNLSILSASLNGILNHGTESRVGAHEKTMCT